MKTDNKMTLMKIYNSANLTVAEIKQMSIWLSSDCGFEADMFYDSSAYEKLYEYFAFEICEMPYGIAKARTGSPDDWILERLECLCESR